MLTGSRTVRRRFGHRGVLAGISTLVHRNGEQSQHWKVRPVAEAARGARRDPERSDRRSVQLGAQGLARRAAPTLRHRGSPEGPRRNVGMLNQSGFIVADAADRGDDSGHAVLSVTR